MVYDMGYQTYRNPHPAPAVVYYPTPSSDGVGSKSSIDYSQPLSVSAAATESSRAAFKEGEHMDLH